MRYQSLSGMSIKNGKKIVILGAGITGLTAAYVLSRAGFDTLLIEKRDYAGGLAASFAYEDYFLDFGPHNFHTHITHVIDFLERDLGVPLKRMPSRPAKIYFNGKIVDYPLSIFNSLRSVNLIVGLRCFIDFLRARLRLRFGKPLPDESFEDWIENRFGNYLYEIYFGSYVEKVWGVSGRELDSVIAKKRIPEPSLTKLLFQVFTGIQVGKKHSEDPHVTGSYYPEAGGIGSIAEQFVKQITAYNGKIELGSTIRELFLQKGSGTISYTAGGALKKAGFDYLINTVPLNSFIPYLNRGSQNRGVPDASFFSYRGMIFLYLILSRSKLTDHPWIYFNERDNKDLIFNRMYEVSNFTSGDERRSYGMLCLEISCYQGDKVWEKSEAELFESCVTFLGKHTFLAKNDVKGYFTKRIEEVYPVFRKGYARNLSDMLGYVGSFGNVITIGRQGLFSYSNMDHCIDMGLRVARLIDNDRLNTGKFFEAYKDYL